MQATRLDDPSQLDELLADLRSSRTLPLPAERKRIREDARCSQRRLARAIGVSWTAIQRWESGATPRHHVAEYARALDELRRIGEVSE